MSRGVVGFEGGAPRKGGHRGIFSVFLARITNERDDDGLDESSLVQTRGRRCWGGELPEQGLSNGLALGVDTEM